MFYYTTHDVENGERVKKDVTDILKSHLQIVGDDSFVIHVDTPLQHQHYSFVLDNRNFTESQHYSELPFGLSDHLKSCYPNAVVKDRGILCDVPFRMEDIIKEIIDIITSVPLEETIGSSFW